MKIYLGFTGNKLVSEFMRKYDCGWMMNPSNYSLNFKESFCADNKCFGAWWNNKEWESQGLKWGNIWDESEFYNFVRKIISLKPDFIVVPDIPAKGMKSFDFSLNHLERIPHPRAFAVQDGMFSNCIHKLLLENPNAFDVIFVGGTSEWKINTAKMWADLAHLHGKNAMLEELEPFKDTLFVNLGELIQSMGQTPQEIVMNDL